MANYQVIKRINGRSWCNSCRRETNQTTCDFRWASGDNGIFCWEKGYELLVCHGCDSYSFRIRSWRDEDQVVNEQGVVENVITEEVYPPRISRPKPGWVVMLDSSIQVILDEVYKALHSDLKNLAAMGARTIIDRIMADKVGESGTFVARMQRMVENRLITDDQSTVLDAVLDLGNAANHRGHLVSGQQVEMAMDIIENMLQTLYVLPPRAAYLRTKITPRV